MTEKITGVVPFFHVTQVHESMKFYQQLGMEVHSTAGDPSDPFWARLFCGPQHLMLGRASGPIHAEEQAAMLYLYCDSVARMRAHLLEVGLVDGAKFTGAPVPIDRRGVVFEVTHPNWMPSGEIRVHDPDGYVLLIGQLHD